MSSKQKKNWLEKSPDLRQEQKVSKAYNPDRARLEGLYSLISRFTAHNRYRVLVVCVLLLLAMVLVFGQTLRHDFINYDDHVYVYENHHVVHGLTVQGITWAFTSKYANNWHPLTWLSHMLDCQLYGLDPWGHHLTNLLLHAATAILLFLVLRQTTGDFCPSAFVAVIFAIHPLRVESVAWVAERKDMLSGLFFMLTLWAYVGYVRSPFWFARYLLVMVLFALGLMTKPMLVTLPFVLLLLDYWPLGRLSVAAMENDCVFRSGSWGRFSLPLRLLMEKGPLLVMVAVSCVLTLWAQSEGIAPDEQIPLSLRIGNAVVSYVAYMGQMFYPADLAVLYPHAYSWLGLPLWKVVGAFLLLVAISGLVIVWGQRYPYLLTGWLWYLGMLLPVIGLVQVGSQAMADRYTYLPQIGLYIALVWGVKQLTCSWAYHSWVCGIGGALVVVVLLGCAWRQTSFWRDSETLWTHTLECTSQNSVAHNNLGVALDRTGRLQEAMKHYRQALRINANSIRAYNNLGNTLIQVGRPQEAIKYLKQALSLKPKYADAHNNLGYALIKLDQFQEAIEHFKQALLLKPEFAEAHNNLGFALINLDRTQEAIEHFKQALLLKPDYAEAHNNLGYALINEDQLQEAIEQFKQATKLKAEFAEAHNNLGNALLSAGWPEEAIESYKQAISIDSGYINAYANLAEAYAKTNQSSEAIYAAQKALGLARSTGQTALVKQIEDWLKAYPAEQSNLSDTLPAGKANSSPP